MVGSNCIFSKLFSKLYLPELPKKENQKNDSLEVGKQRSSFKTAAGTRRTLSPRCLHLRARKAEFWQPLAAPLLVLKFCRLLFVVH